MTDSATIDDAIFTKVSRPVFDSTTIDDTISKKVFIRLTDGARAESITTADKIFTKKI